MWSKENKRFTMLVVAVVLVALGTVAGIVSLVNHEHGKDTVLVTGFVGVLLVQLLSMMRAEQERKVTTEAREEIKQETRATKEMVVTAVQIAAETPTDAQVTMPQTKEELDGLIGDVVRKFVDATADDIVRKAAEAAATRAAEVAAAKVLELAKAQENDNGRGI